MDDDDGGGVAYRDDDDEEDDDFAAVDVNLDVEGPGPPALRPAAPGTVVLAAAPGTVFAASFAASRSCILRGR